MKLCRDVWHGVSCGSAALAVSVAPKLQSRLLARTTVDALTQQVGVADMAGILLDEVDDDVARLGLLTVDVDRRVEVQVGVLLGPVELREFELSLEDSTRPGVLDSSEVADHAQQRHRRRRNRASRELLSKPRRPQRRRASVTPSATGSRHSVIRSSPASFVLSAWMARVSSSSVSWSSTVPPHNVLSIAIRPPGRTSRSNRS